MKMQVSGHIVRVSGMRAKPPRFTLAVNCARVVKDTVSVSYSDDVNHFVKCKVTTQKGTEVELHFDMNHYHEALILGDTITKLRNNIPEVKNE